MKPSWDGAPEWANVLVVHKQEPTLYAFSESFTLGCRFIRCDYTKEFNNFMTSAWEVVEERPFEAPLWNGEGEIPPVGTRAYMSSPFAKEEVLITYVGNGLLCYIGEEGYEESVRTSTAIFEAIPQYSEDVTEMAMVLAGIPEIDFSSEYNYCDIAEALIKAGFKKH